MPIFHFIWSSKLSSYLAKRDQHNRPTWMRIMFAPFLWAALTNLNKRESIRIWNSTESKMGLLISEKKQNIKVFLDTNWQNPFDAWKNSLSVPKKIRTWPPLKSYIEQIEKKKGPFSGGMVESHRYKRIGGQRPPLLFLLSLYSLFLLRSSFFFLHHWYPVLIMFLIF
jgi:hypothetical protein